MYGIAMEYVKRTLVRIAYTQEDHITTLPPFHRCICPFLAAASHVYALAVEVRKLLYSWGIFQSRRLDVPVISVGNLTWGGNGKTPMTEFLALLFAQTGISPLILTRGYAGGDETKMLQRHLIDTSVKIGSGPNRAHVGSSFLQQHGVMKVNRKSDLAENIFPFMESFTFANHLCDAIGVIILDDGMQHWSLSRDLEIVMLNCVSLWGNGRMIPRGPLRESLESLRRADIIVLHHADLISDEKHQYIGAVLKDLLKEKIIPTFCSRMVPCYFFRIDCQLSKVPLIAVHNMVVLCVSGIGCPESLSLTMKKLGAAYVDRVDFSDHHSFQDKDLILIEKKLCDLKDEFGNQVVIVLTEKIYKTITQAYWYEWNAKLHANLIVLLEKYEQWDEAQSSLELTQNLSPADKVRFYCALIECYSKFGLKDQVLSAYDVLKELPYKSVDLIGYKSLINALAIMNFPHEAEETLKQMKGSGYKPSADEFKSILYSYGRCGHFQEMERIFELLEGSGYSVDTATINMVLKSYGSSQDYGNIKRWLKTMQVKKIGLSTRTYNAVANSCPTLVSFALLHEIIPLSTRSLLNVMAERGNISEELLLVEELLGLGLLPEITDWSSKQWALDLHGLVPSAAYAMLLVWLEEVKSKIECETELPSEIFVVCGLGKQSPTRGHSSVKTLMSEMMFKMKSPFKLDRLNKGRFVAKSNTVKAWLSQVI